MKRRILAVLLSLCMLFSLLPATAFAAGDPVTYIERSWDGSSVQETEQTCNSYTSVDTSTTTWNAGWYVVDSTVTIDDRITVKGNVNLILTDGTTLTADSGITVNRFDRLTIYGQRGDSGKLVANPHTNRFYALIGGQEYMDSGRITIHGGSITANNASNSVASCIGGGGGSSAGYIGDGSVTN